MGCREALRPRSPFWDEAVQEALVHLWNWLCHHPDAERPRSWFYQAGKRAALYILRREARSRAATAELELRTAATSSGDPALVMQRQEQRARVASALALLPHAQRFVVTHRIWDGLTFREIAELAGCSRRTCQAQFRRGVAALRWLLGPDVTGS
ncbi:MAG: sigma-70 family RNA polymerase sigma factor [Planctomycetota bacterium]